ncbi:hypothetical protein MHJ86_08930 [Corynebacterium afermentans]|nr:hypothetical protein [Corynebacterium afermentans]
MTTAYTGPERPFQPHNAPKPSPIDAFGDNLIGIIGLACAVLGTLLSFNAVTANFGAPLLQAAFILGVVGLFPQGAKKVWPAAALITAILGSALSIMLVQHQVTSQFDSSTAQFTDLERQLEQLNQTFDPYSTDPLSGPGAPTGWPTAPRL